MKLSNAGESMDDSMSPQEFLGAATVKLENARRVRNMALGLFVIVFGVSCFVIGTELVKHQIQTPQLSHGL